MRSPVLVELVCKGKENFMSSKNLWSLRLSKNINLHPPAPNVATKWTKPAELQWSQLRMGKSSTRGPAAREMTVKLFMGMLMVDILTKSGTMINISMNQHCSRKYWFANKDDITVAQPTTATRWTQDLRIRERSCRLHLFSLSFL